MKNIIIFLVLGLFLLITIPKAFESYQESVNSEMVSIIKKREINKKHADWFKSLTTGQQDSVKRLRKSLR